MIENLVVRLIGQNASFKSSMRSAVGMLDTFEQTATKLGKTLSLRVTTPVVAFGAMAVRAAANTEKLKISLSALAGGIEEGNSQFQKLRDFSASTPFRFGELIKANNIMMGFGQNTDDAYRSVRQLANIAAITGGELSNMALPLAQSFAAGRVMTQDLNQFVNNGVPIFKLLGDVTGKSTAELRKMAEQGDITFKILNRAFERATRKGGMFFRGVDKQAETFSGKLSTLKDNVQILAEEFATPVMDWLKPQIDSATKLAKAVNNLDPSTKNMIINLGALAAAAGPVTYVFGKMTAGAMALGGAITAFAAGPLAIAVAGLAAVKINLDAAYKLMDKITAKYARQRGYDSMKDSPVAQRMRNLVASGAEQQRLERQHKENMKVEVDSSHDPVAKTGNMLLSELVRLQKELVAKTQMDKVINAEPAYIFSKGQF